MREDQEPIERFQEFDDAVVTEGQRNNACKIVLKSLHLRDIVIRSTLEKGIAVVIFSSDYCIGHRDYSVPVKIFVDKVEFAHAVMTALYYGINVSKKLKSGSNFTVRFFAESGDVIAKDIPTDIGFKIAATTCV